METTSESVKTSDYQYYLIDSLVVSCSLIDNDCASTAIKTENLKKKNIIVGFSL